MRESCLLQYEVICADVCTTSPFILGSLWRRRGSPRLEDPVDDGAESNECTNAKEDRERKFMQGAQISVIKTIYYQGEEYTYEINALCDLCSQS